MPPTILAKAHGAIAENNLVANRHIHKVLRAVFLSAMCCLPSTAHAEPSYCLTLYGECKYKPGFTHFDYVNPNAPIGGNIKLAETGTFDSLNPFILKGVKAPAISGLFESLMATSLDEPMTMYGLLAETVEIADDHSYADFVIRKEARFHDGSPVTPEDVVFSFSALKEKGDPTFAILYAPITKVEKVGKRSVRFYFDDPNNKELPSMAAGMPVLSKAYYEKVDFEKTTLEPPLGTGPYQVETVEAGKTIIYKRNPNYWGWHLPVMRGQFNFETIRYDMYRDENVTLEALKAGSYDFRREYISRNWATAYDSPAVKDGRIVKKLIPGEVPQGMQAFIFNTRKAKFADRRVREAISLSMDYEWLNKTIFYGAYLRNTSFFKNTAFEAKGVPEGKELELLEPFREQLPPALFTQEFSVPKTDGSGNNRPQLLKAQKLLNEAGWKVKDGRRVNDAGEPLHVEFLLRQPTMERVIGPMRRSLERLGISASIRMVDNSQYQKRIDTYDFEIISVWLNRGVFFPGNEQMTLWHSSQANLKGSNNVVGAQHPAVDAALAALIGAKDLEELKVAGRALDRILLWEHYAIPHWHSAGWRVAYWNKFGLPKTQAKYDLCFQCWWVKEDSQ